MHSINLSSTSLSSVANDVSDNQDFNRGNRDNLYRIHFREVVHVNIEKIMEVLISLLAEQEGVTIEYTIEKPA